MDHIETAFSVNGTPLRRTVDGSRSLLSFLRDDLGLTGAKNGCGTGHCGACTVLINGSPEKSCIIRLRSSRLTGAEITTIEGLAGSEGTLHPIQQAFINAGAVQCGFCTPGMILTVKSLLEMYPNPSRQDIREYIGPRNLCRCTGYDKIFQAVEESALVLSGNPPLLSGSPDDAPLRKSEARVKVNGSLKYADDLTDGPFLFGRILFSLHPHAVLAGLDCSAALSVEGVAGVITAEDIPGSKRIGLVERDQPSLIGLGDEIRSVADPVCAVFADTKSACDEAFSLIVPEYQVLPGVFTVEDARKPDAVAVWPNRPDNIFYNRVLERGDVDREMKAARLVVEGDFSFSRIIHGYMEPEAGMARPDGRGGVEIFYPTQTVFDDRMQVAEVLNLPPEQVRVIQLPTGGAFGGKEDVLFQHILALAALKFARPVKITLSRVESLRVVQKKHPGQFRARLGIDGDGRFRALEADIQTDKGAYASLGFDIIENMMAFIGGPYIIPAVKVRGLSVHTHNVMSGAMRGFGVNQSNFVIESLVDEASVRLGIDPIEIRRLNALRVGSATITGHVLEPGIPAVLEVLEAAANALKDQTAPDVPPEMTVGFGVACGVKNVGFGHGLPESAGARVELTSEGRCRLFITHHEYGQGAVIGNARIASETLGIPIELIDVRAPDTDTTPYTGATTASRQTFLSGNATLGACRNLISALFSSASVRTGIVDPASFAIRGDSVVDRSGEIRIPIADLGIDLSAEFRAIAPETTGFPEPSTGDAAVGSDNSSRRTHWAYAYGFQAAWVAVNETTGEVKVLKLLTVSDVGRILNRRAVEGQMDGGAVMGLGFALSEQFVVEDGLNITRTLDACGLPRASHIPEIIKVTVEVPHPGGPLGMKGFAEAPSLATAPAIANAIRNATGIRMHHLPMTPEKVKGELNGHAR